MKIVDRYIAKTILLSTSLVVLVLLGIQIFINLVGQMQDIGTNNYGLLQALLYVPMSLPSDLYQLFPVAGLLGSLIGLGWLASKSELVVMRSAGMSIARITWSVVKIAIFMLIIVSAIGELVAPKLEVKAFNYKQHALQKAALGDNLHDLWLRRNDNYIHVNQVVDNTHLQGVSNYQFASDRRLKRISYAQTGVRVGQGLWRLNNITSTVFMGDKVINERQGHGMVNFDLNLRLMHLTKLATTQESIVGLYRHIRYSKAVGHNSQQLEFSFWQRLIQPITTIVMICLGVPFIFGSLRSSSMGYRILTGVIIGFLFYVLNQLFGPFTLVLQLSPFWAAAIPTICFAIACSVMLLRLK